jgi:ABC-type enterochelin transport system ATPase subunit
MNEKLIVKDFGPIKNAELDLKKVTIFIGPQGSGKSTLAKLVAIFRDSNFLMRANSNQNLNFFFKIITFKILIEKKHLSNLILNHIRELINLNIPTLTWRNFPKV